MKNLVLMAISFTVALCVAEVGLRVMGYRGEVSWNLQDVITVDDKILNYRLRPNSISFSGEVAYQLNSKGFRDVERDSTRDENVFRIVVLGDSVAFGYKVQFQDTFSRQLEAQMNALKGKKVVEVINISIPGLNTYQEAHLLLEAGAQYHPDMLLVVYSLNDADAGVAYAAAETSCRIQLINFPVPCGIKTAMKSLASLFLLKEGIDRLLWKWNVGDTDDPLGSIQADFFGKLYSHGTKWQDNVVEGFRTIAQFSLERNIPTIVVVFPVMYDFSRYQWQWIHKKIAQEAVAHRFHIVDLLEPLSAYPVKDVRVERGDFVHPGATGYKIAAAAVATFLDKNPGLFSTPLGDRMDR